LKQLASLVTFNKYSCVDGAFCCTYILYHNCRKFFFQAVLAATLACALAEPSVWAGGFTTYTGIAGAPFAAPFAAAPFAAPLAAAPVAAPLAAAPIAAPVAAAAIAAPVATQSKYHFQDTLGQASYGHAEPFQTHNAVQVSKQLKSCRAQRSISFTRNEMHGTSCKTCFTQFPQKFIQLSIPHFTFCFRTLLATR
jgi:hypothetical protein